MSDQTPVATPITETQIFIRDKLDPLFAVFCPALSCDVYLPKSCWYGHILKQHRKTMDGKLPLVKSVIGQIQMDRMFFRFDESFLDSWFYDHACPHFKPRFDYLRVAFKKIDYGVVIVASAYPRNAE